MGEAVGGVAGLFRAAGKPLRAVAGSIAITAEERAALGLRGAHAVVDEAGSVGEAMMRAGVYVELMGQRLGNVS